MNTGTNGAGTEKLRDLRTRGTRCLCVRRRIGACAEGGRMPHILVIDDDDAVTSLLRRGLADEGY